MNPIRVCLLVNTVGEDAGAERQVVETARRLDPDRFEVHVVCLEDSPRLQALAPRCRVHVFPVQSVYTFNGLRQMWQFRRYVAQYDIHIVHAYMEKTAIFGVLSMLGKKNVILITSRLNMGYWYTPFYRRFFQLLNHFTTRIMANAESVKQVTAQEEKVSPEKIDVVYQGVDISRYGPQSGDLNGAEWLRIPPETNVIGLVANLRPVKDTALFLRAARLVLDEMPKTAFLLVGQGSMRQELGRLADELKISRHVFFTDGRGAVPDYLRRLSIGCLSSKSEGFSNAILEYMASGLPVVAMDVGGNREAIVNGQTGYLVSERSPEAFAAPLLVLLRDPALRSLMGRRGMERCREVFDIDITMRQLEDYYLRWLEHSR